MAFSLQSPWRSGARIILSGREVAGGVPLAETPGSTKLLPAVSSQPGPHRHHFHLIYGIYKE